MEWTLVASISSPAVPVIEGRRTTLVTPAEFPRKSHKISESIEGPTNSTMAPAGVLLAVLWSNRSGQLDSAIAAASPVGYFVRNLRPLDGLIKYPGLLLYSVRLVCRLFNWHGFVC